MNLFGAEVVVNVDPTAFETDYSLDSSLGFVESPTVEAATNKQLTSGLILKQTNHSTGKISFQCDNADKGITNTKFIVGSYKLKVKSLADASKLKATLSEVVIADAILGQEQETNLVNNANITVVNPSDKCDLTNLTSTQSSVSISKDSSDNKKFVATVPYSVTQLNTANLKPSISAGANVTYSPNGKVNLTEGENTITITVTAENGVAKNNYSLVVTREASETTKTLKSLIVKNGTNAMLTKTEAELTSGETYTLPEVEYANKDNLTIETIKNGNFSTVEIKVDNVSKHVGVATEANNTLALGSLSAGAHTVKVIVTSQSGETTEYVLNIVVKQNSSQPTPPDTNPDDNNNNNNNNSNNNNSNNNGNSSNNNNSTTVDALPYILGMSLLGANNLVALIVIFLLARPRDKNKK